MRVDLDALLPLIRGTDLYKKFKVIKELEKYTLLTPPFEGSAVKELFARAQQELQFKFAVDYYWFLKCCDGGLLFTNAIYSVLDPEEPHNDLVERNRFLRENDEIPENTVAIGETNYGCYIVFCESGKGEMGIWDSEAQEYIARFKDLYEWLDDAIREACSLIGNDGLPVIDDFEDDEANDEDDVGEDDGEH